MKKYFWVLICLAWLVASSSQAVLYRYEPFTYTADTGLRFSPGYGIGGSEPYSTNRAISLTYEGLLTGAGGKVQVPGQRGLTGFSGTVNYTYMTNNPPTNPVFSSLLLHVASVGTLRSNAFIFSPRSSLSGLTITNHPGGPTKYKIGLQTAVGQQPIWSDNGGSGYDAGTTYFIAMTYTNSGGLATNTFSRLWVNPPTGESEPPVAAQIAMPARYSTNGIFIMNFGNGNGNQTPGTVIYLDEIRLGSTWTDVTPSGVKPYPILTDAGVLPAYTNLMFIGNTQNVFIAVKNANGTLASNVNVTLTSLPAGFSANNSSNSEYGLISTGQTKTNSTAFQIIPPLNGALETPYTIPFQITGITSNMTYTTNSSFYILLKQSVTVTGQDVNNKFSLSANTNQITTNALMTVSNSSDRVLVCTLAESAPWLTLPGGTTLTVAPRSASNVVMVAGPVATEQQLTTPLTVTYDQTVTNFQNFTVQFDVGPKIDPLVATPVIAEIGGVTNFPGLYEPGEVLNITMTSTNNGAITVNNITNTLTGPAGFGISPASAIYPSMTVGSVTSTTYQVSIPAGTPEGFYTFTARNSADGKSWSGTFTLAVYNRAVPAVTPTNLTLTMPANGTAAATITLTNSGNKATTFALSDSGVWLVNYLVSTQTESLVWFAPIPALEPDPNNTFTNWSGDDTALMNFGFSFPFYSTNYNSFSVSRFGAIGFGTSVGANTAIPPALPFGASPLAAAFWGNDAVDTNSVRYLKQADKLVAAWGNRTGHEFQAWIYTNGQIRYLYEQTAWTGGVIGVQQTATANQTVNYNPGKGSQSVLLTRQVNAWVTPDMTNGTLNGLSSQAITFTANAAGQASGTNVFNVTVTWGDGSTAIIAVTTIIAPLGGPCNITFTNKLPAQLAAKPFSTTNLPIVLQNSGYVATNVTSYLTVNPAYSSWLTVNSGMITNLSISGPLPSTNAAGLVTNLFNISTTTNAPTGTFPDAFMLSVAGIGSDGSTNTYSTDISLTVVPTVFASINKTRLFAPTTNGTDTTVLTVSNTAGWALSYNVNSPDAWLSYPSGTLSLAPNSFTNITLTANAGLTAGVGQYDGTLTVSQLNNTTPQIGLSMLFEVGNRALPSGTPTNLVITVPRNGMATGTLTLSNAGNVSAAFALTDNGPWSVYSVETQTIAQTVTRVWFPPIPALEPDTNNTFVSWTSNSTALMNFDFAFPFYGIVYTNFSVSGYGAIGLGTNVDENTRVPPALPSTNVVIIGTVTNRSVRPAIAPFWGDTAVATNSVRYEKQADKLVVAWGNRTGQEFQAWVYTNGQIRYLYERTNLYEQTTWAGGVIGVQLRTNLNQTVAYTPGRIDGESILLTPQPWVTPNVTTGTVNPSGSQVITFTANATNQATGTNNFNVTVTWGNGIIQTIPVRVIVTSPNPGISVPPSVTFSGLAGDITITNMMIVNTGDVAVAYSITDTSAQTAGYTWTNVLFNWDTSGNNLSSGMATFSDGETTDWMPIGFDFPFYGNVYTQYQIDTWGSIVLNPSDIRVIMAFFDDLTLDDNATVRYGKTDNKLIVTWQNMLQTPDGADQTFQAVLYKNGNILLQYQSLTDSNAWPMAITGLFDTTNRYNFSTLSNWQTEITKDRVREQAILFTPVSPRVISVDPSSGDLPVGGTQTIKIIGDARSLTSGGTNNVSVNTIFSINHPGAGLVTSVVSGVTNIAPPIVVKPVSVLFVATNSLDGTFPTLDSDEDGMTDRTEAIAGTDEYNADSIFGMSVVQNPEGSRKISWPKANDNLSRTYTVWYTTDLMSDWIVLYSNDNFYSYTDHAHADVPVIYYRVTVK